MSTTGVPSLFFDAKYEDLEYERRITIKAARQLCYPKDVIQKLEAAKTGAELTNIMKDARNGKYDT